MWTTKYFLHIVWSLTGAVLLLSGCDTAGFYRTTDSDEARVKTEGVEAVAHLRRFNFSFLLSLELKNQSAKKVSFEVEKVRLVSAVNGKELPYTESRIFIDGEREEFVGENPTPNINSNQVIMVEYNFDGRPIMGWLHPIKTDEEKHLHLIVAGLLREGQVVPLDFDFKEQ